MTGHLATCDSTGRYNQVDDEQVWDDKKPWEYGNGVAMGYQYHREDE